jgi:preprotein translocase subunit SecD
VSSYTEDDLRGALAEEAQNAPPATDPWRTLRRRVSVRRWQRGGFALGVAAIVAVAVFVAVPDGGNGAKISFAHDATVTWAPHRPLSNAELQQTIGVLRQRLDALDVSDAAVSSQDGLLVVQAPHLEHSLAAGIMAAGVLQYRPVLAFQTPGQRALSAAEAATGTLVAAEHVFAGAACPSDGANGTQPASQFLVACSEDGSAEYLLGPVALDNADIQQANTVQDTNTDAWFVELGFTAAGGRDWQTFTAATAGKPELPTCGPPRGCNSIGIVIDGTVVSAPRVQVPGGLRGGQTQIGVDGTRKDAQLIAALASTMPLPTSFTEVEPSTDASTAP